MTLAGQTDFKGIDQKRGGLIVVAFDWSPFTVIHAEIFKQISAGPIL
jgi:hypothetical protein